MTHWLLRRIHHIVVIHAPRCLVIFLHHEGIFNMCWCHKHVINNRTKNNRKPMNQCLERISHLFVYENLPRTCVSFWDSPCNPSIPPSLRSSVTLCWKASGDNNLRFSWMLLDLSSVLGGAVSMVLGVMWGEKPATSYFCLWPKSPNLHTSFVLREFVYVGFSFYNHHFFQLSFHLFFFALCRCADVWLGKF